MRSQMAEYRSKLRTVISVVVLGFCLVIILPMPVIMAQGTLEDAEPLTLQVVLLYQQGKYEEAIPLAERVLEIRTRLFGPTDIRIGADVNNLAELYRMTGRYAKAEPLHVRAVEITRRAVGPEHPDYATTLHNLGALYDLTGRYDKAEPLYLQALEIRKKALGPEHPDYAESLSDLAGLYDNTGRYDKAEPLYLEAAEITRKVFGPDDPDYATSLNNLAALYDRTGRYDKAESLYVQALEITKTALGTEHPFYARSLNNLAELYRTTGRYDKAEPLYSQSAEIRRRVLGPEHPAYATSLNNLALLYWSTGRYDKAESLYLQAAEIRRKVLGPEHPDYAAVLNNLAELYRGTGVNEKAEQLYLQAAEIIRKAVGPEHPDYATCLGNVALLYLRTGNYNKAEQLFAQVAEIRKKALGPEHPIYATTLHNLAALYASTGRYEKAESLYLQAAEIFKKALGPEHPDYAASLSDLAVMYESTDRSKEALALLMQSMDIEQANLQRVFDVSSEVTMRAYFATIDTSLKALVSIAASQPKGNGTSIGPTLMWVLRRKAIILDTLVRFRQAERLAESDPLVARSAARLRYLRQQMSNLPLSMSDSELQQQMAKLRQEADQLEADLNRRLAALRPEQATNAVDVTSVRTMLPAGAALVELVRSEIFDFKATGKAPRWKPAHYFAFILTHNETAALRMIDLGETVTIDETIGKMRQNIAQFGDDWKAGKIDSKAGPQRPTAIKSEKDAEQHYSKVGAQLYDLVFAPVRKELGSSVKTIYVAPDDQLNLVPFEALVDGDGKYLIENYKFVYLSSGRDLLRSTPNSTAQGTVVFADPNYDMDVAMRAKKAKELLTSFVTPSIVTNNQAGSRVQNSSTYHSTVPEKVQQSSRGRTRSGRWDRLPASADEAQDVERELKGTDYGPVKEYLKGEALEEVFKQIRSPRVLHVSTHGFFPEQTADSEITEGPIDLHTGSVAIIGQKLLARTGNPLLQSGLVLAGANTIGANTQTPETEVDDGWVMAEEIAMMDLQGTDLVVLSACGTGLGAVSAGEGVYGLRRAFQNARARTIISTLFEVPDAESGQIMHSFYERLKNKQSKLDALHEAQLGMIENRRKQEGAAHPFFWASFVLLGNPN
jgi:CHAT domain-containing protein/tetratricopeptide (TPR) repeat protein